MITDLFENNISQTTGIDCARGWLPQIVLELFSLHRIADVISDGQGTNWCGLFSEPFLKLGLPRVLTMNRNTRCHIKIIKKNIISSCFWDVHQVSSKTCLEKKKKEKSVLIHKPPAECYRYKFELGFIFWPYVRRAIWQKCNFGE